MSDRMYIMDVSSGKIKYIVTDEKTINVFTCNHNFTQSGGERGETYTDDGPCHYCGLYKDELGIKE